MSYFNEDQQDYMRSLAEMPLESKCWCGWHRLGECQNCATYAPGKTCADKVAAMCPECRYEPSPNGGQIEHRIGCPKKAKP